MRCQKALSIEVVDLPCVDWTTLGAFVYRPGSPTIVGAGSLGKGHPGATTWSQFATAGPAFSIRAQTLFATLIHTGPACNCNLEVDCTTYVDLGGFIFGQVKVFAPLQILARTVAGVGITNDPFTIPDGTVIPVAVQIQCQTDASDLESVILEFTLTTV